MSSPNPAPARKPKAFEIEVSPAHYLQLILHRKWIVIVCFAVVSILTAVVAQRLPNVYTSETVILVDPQKVPESYVKATVTGDVRNRLGTLTQQILSATRLQKIIDSLNLYPDERKSMVREDILAQMRKDITVSMVTGAGTQGDLQAFKISYSGRNPRLTARVTSELASLFIDENLKAREQQANGTTDFLQHQLDETRKTLETQEAQLRDFRLKHLGEMPEQQTSVLTVLNNLQSALQREADALGRAEQQRSYLQTMGSQSSPVVDMDSGDTAEARSLNPNTPAKSPAATKQGGGPAQGAGTLADDKARLAALLARYTETYPEVRKLRQQIAEREAKEKTAAPAPVQTAVAEPPVPAPPAKKKQVFIPANTLNPVIVSQLSSVEIEIAKHKEEMQRLNRQIAGYQSKLEVIPVREQQIAELQRDYAINKNHYSQLLDKQLSAETASQLEVRQKGETFKVLDPAQIPGKPSKPNRKLINLGGALGGLLLGLLIVVGMDMVSQTISSTEQIPLWNGNRVLETIPVILTESDVRRKKRQLIVAAASGFAATITVGVMLFIRYRG